MISMKKILKAALQQIPSLKEKKITAEAIRKYGTNKDLTITATAGSGWTMGSTLTATLVGNTLRVVITATKSTATGAGDITNTKIATITIDHQGYIAGVYDADGVSSTDGHIAGCYTYNNTTSGNTSTFDIAIGATHAAVTTTRFWLNIPVILNIDAFL